jgi:hypothetical protein
LGTTASLVTRPVVRLPEEEQPSELA